METGRKLRKGVLAGWKLDRIWMKVFRLNGKLAEIDGSSPRFTESCWKLMEGLLAEWNVHGRFPSWSEIWWKLTEDLLAALKVGRSWRNVSRLHEKQMKVDKKFPGRTNLVKVGKLHPTSQKIDKSRRKFSRLHGKLTEVYGRFPGRTEIWRKLTEIYLETWKVDESWWKIS